MPTSFSSRYAAAASLSLVSLLAACGGGGGDDAAPAPGASLSPLQQAVQKAFTADGSHVLSSSLPTTGLPTSGTHYAFSVNYTLAQPITETPQRLTVTPSSISPALSLPDFTRFFPARSLINGAIHVQTGLSNNENIAVAFDADGAFLEGRTTTGLRAWRVRIASFDVIPLAGEFLQAPAEVKTWNPLVPLVTNTSLLRANPTFLAGAAYYKRKTTAMGDSVSVQDCTGIATGTNQPTPCSIGGTIESNLAAVTTQVYGRPLVLADGAISTIEGARMWVSTATVPTNTSSTAAHLAIFELNGSVYRGLLQRDGTQIMSRLSNAQVVDYSLRFNEAAVQSLKAAAAQ